MTATVIQYVLDRLKQLGVTNVFGVPGDYAFLVDDAGCNDLGSRWIGCANELNAAYAADGYARVRGVAAVCTTFGVGELRAANGIAETYAEHLPVFHLVGMPGTAAQGSRCGMHHTFGADGFELFRRMTEPVVAAWALMTPQNVTAEIERLIEAALYHRRPVDMAFLADRPALGAGASIGATRRRWPPPPTPSPRRSPPRAAPASCPASSLTGLACAPTPKGSSTRRA